ncbi:MAG TPA: DUF4136 domain-containing protein [Woeseiaceae bacterium]|nr:DUF4136 domain-containing protein [Woeseiaceae bacterium]
MLHTCATTKLQQALVILLLVIAQSGCATIRTGSHYDETANFAAFKTFSWVSETPYVTDGESIRISPLSQQNIQAAIRRHLESAGYEFLDTPGNGDMLIAYTVGTRDKIRVESYPVDYVGVWGWHIHGSHYVIRETRKHQYTSGTLGVDIFEGKTNKPIWHGWAEKTIRDSDRKDPKSVIDDGVAKLFSSFPQ